MNYAPPSRSDDPAATSRLVFRTPVADADKAFFLGRDNRFFLPVRGHAVFDPAASAPGRGHDPSPRPRSAEASRSEEEEEEYVDDEEEEEDVDEGDGEIDGLDNGSHKHPHNSSASAHSSSEKACHRDRVLSQEDRSSFGSSGGGLEKDGINCEGSVGELQRQQVRASPHANALAIMAPEAHYAQILQGGDAAPLAVLETDAGNGPNGCGGQSRRRDGPGPVELGESLRKHLSDPISGTLMDDAMILACGHSFGRAGMDQVMRLKVCCSCGKPVLEDSIRPNLALRSAVVAFLREEELQSLKAPKRRRERFEQDKSNNDSFPFDISKAKGVQFPFSVSDRVIIKGNKRTPQRFVGRIAVVTAQCLNGWYVVKTLDNAESVKLQYRSLEKAPDDPPSDLVLSKAAHLPNWL